MKEVFPGLSYGPAPKSATLPEILRIAQIIVNLREPSETSDWYKDQAGEYIGFPLSQSTPESTHALCQSIVYSIKEGKRVYIHDRDGFSTLGPIVLGCWYWLSKKRKWDPLEEVKKQWKEFRMCPTKDQVKELDAIKEIADKMNTWEKLGINIEKRNTKK